MRIRKGICPFWAGKWGLLDEFLRKRLAVQSEITDQFGHAAQMAFAPIAGF